MPPPAAGHTIPEVMTVKRHPRPDREPRPLPVYLPEVNAVESVNECTGHIPRPPAGPEEEASYRGLYSTGLPEEEAEKRN